MATALKEKVHELEERLIALELLSIHRAPSQSTRKSRLEMIRRTAGALKGRLPKNPVAWQRKIRREWERS